MKHEVLSFLRNESQFLDVKDNVVDFVNINIQLFVGKDLDTK